MLAIIFLTGICSLYLQVLINGTSFKGQNGSIEILLPTQEPLRNPIVVIITIAAGIIITCDYLKHLSTIIITIISGLQYYTANVWCCNMCVLYE